MSSGLHIFAGPWQAVFVPIMNAALLIRLAIVTLALTAPAAGRADDKVATAVYAKIEKGYKRAKAKDGSFKPEYYALSNGGRIYGTVSDHTVDRVTYPQVAEIAMRLLAQQNYHYAKTKEEAKLLLVLQWGNTLAFDGSQKEMNVAAARGAIQTLETMQTDLINKLVSDGMPFSEAEAVAKNTTAGFAPSITDPAHKNEHAAVAASVGAIESQMLRTLVDNRVRDQLNERNARVLGYLDDLADSNDIRRWAGGGDRYADLITEVEESRYYIVVSAYDFPELLKTKKQKLLWQTRVSVRSPGNTFDDSFVAMLKTAAPYFGRESGKLVRREEPKGTVELGDLKFLGEAKEQTKTPTKEESK
jgi:hypothetical protein